MAKRVSRRDVTRAVPLLMLGSAIGGMSRFLAACTSDSGSSLKDPGTGPTRGTVPPNDQNEYVDPNQAQPVNTGDTPPMVPNPVWEARARQLEDDQKRLYGNVFSSDQSTNGPMVGKEKSHVPTGLYALDGTLKHVTITVAHVMGGSGLDAGSYDAGDAAKEAEAGPMDAGADAGDAGDAGSADAGDAAAADAAKPPVHYITTIYLRAMVDGTDTVVGLWEFQSTDAAPPSARFTLPAGVTSVTAYEWCTLHGLWKSDPIATA